MTALFHWFCNCWQNTDRTIFLLSRESFYCVEIQLVVLLVWNWLCFILLFKSVVRCLLSTCEPAFWSLPEIWSTPVTLLILILLNSFVIVSVCWFAVKVVLGAFCSNTVYARLIVFIKDNFFINIICNIYTKKKELKVSSFSTIRTFPTIK